MTKLRLTASAFVLACAAGGAHAQQASSASSAAFPEKAIRVVSPFPPGGAADTLARALAQKLTESFGRPAVVENRAGAGGTIGTDVVAKSAPDGYTLLLGNVSTLAIAPSLYTKLPYDPAQDFSPITLVGKSPLVFSVHPSVPAKTLKDLIALARSRPDRMTFGSSGAGSITHLTGELLNAAAKVNVTHVPYKGSAPVIQALLAGEVDMGVLQVVEVLPHHRSGRLRALAVSGTQRSTALPKIPYAGELGMRGLESTTWYCVVAPRGVPQPIVKTLHATLSKAITSADFVKRFTAGGVSAEASTPEALANLVRGDIQRWAEVAKRSGVKLD
jgi:tripartite-type tricarboxylate transporter receptor subunit TctC